MGGHLVKLRPAVLFPSGYCCWPAVSPPLPPLTIAKASVLVGKSLLAPTTTTTTQLSSAASLLGGARKRDGGVPASASASASVVPGAQEIQAATAYGRVGSGVTLSTKFMCKPLFRFINICTVRVWV